LRRQIIHGITITTGILLQGFHLPGKSITGWPDARLLMMLIPEKNIEL
jgi:hypothetical protein